MHYYFVEALPIHGGPRFRDVVRENSPRDVRAKLSREGYVIAQLVAVDPDNTSVPTSYAEVKAEFFRQLALYRDKGATLEDLRAGLGPMFSHVQTPPRDQLRSALAALRGHTIKTLRDALVDIIDQLARGSKTAAALDTAPEVFSSDEITLVELAEAHGHEVRTLKAIAQQLQRDGSTRNKVDQALWYPSVLVLGAIGLVTFYGIVMVPQLTAFYQSLGLAPIFPLNVFIALSAGFRRPACAIVILTAAGIASALGAVAYRTSPRLRYRLDMARLNLPAVGDLERHKRTARALFAIDLMVRAGETKRALGAAYATAVGPVYRDALRRARDRMTRGEANLIADAIAPETEVFDPLLVGIIRSAERYGKQTEDFPNAIDAVHERIDNTIAALPKRLEVTFGIVLAAIIGFIIYAIVMPTQYATAHFH